MPSVNQAIALPCGSNSGNPASVIIHATALTEEGDVIKRCLQFSSCGCPGFRGRKACIYYEIVVF